MSKSAWKRSRHLGFSTLETGDELKKRPMARANTAKIARGNPLSMVFSSSKSRNSAPSMASPNVSSAASSSSRRKTPTSLG